MIRNLIYNPGAEKGIAIPLSNILKIFLSLLLLTGTCFASVTPSRSALAPPPEWSKLEKFQYTITRQKFLDLLENLYVPRHGWKKWVKVAPKSAQIITRKGCPPFLLHFATNPRTAQPVLHGWKSRSHLSELDPSKPLEGLKITLDPGHLGGKWAIMEERWFKVGRNLPVEEGEMTLRVAKILAPRLRSLGATVTLTRSQAGPTTSYRPADFRLLAASELHQIKICAHSSTIRKKSEQLFYQVAEIRHRAGLINEDFRPDLVLCLHFDAEEWGNQQHPQLVNKNHLHILVTGGASKEEFSKEDQRFDILFKLLSRTDTEEIPIANAVSSALAQETKLPSYTYKGNNAIRINSYVWGRNLLATRLYQCPVVFVEAYVMNNPEFVARIQAGDYVGTKSIFGISPKKSIYREYTDGIIKGLIQYYSTR